MSDEIKVPSGIQNYFTFLASVDTSKAVNIGGHFVCPCCQLPTLDSRADYEICRICWWEDDGQDDSSADLVVGGPNGGSSLAQARKNFQNHFHMYVQGDGIDVVEKPSVQRLKLIEYVSDVVGGKSALNIEKLHELIEIAS